jgi:hypothetical protein
MASKSLLTSVQCCNVGTGRADLVLQNVAGNTFAVLLCLFKYLCKFAQSKDDILHITTTGMARLHAASWSGCLLLPRTAIMRRQHTIGDAQL